MRITEIGHKRPGSKITLLISLTALMIVVMVSCGGSSDGDEGISWDAYRSQIDTWQERVNEKLAGLDQLLAVGSFEDQEWRSSLRDLGIEIDSMTLAVSKIRPPAELRDFHESFVLAADFYKLIGRLLVEVPVESETDRAAIIVRITGEIAFGEANMKTAQSIFDQASRERNP